MEKLILRLKSLTKTLFFFIVACCLVPFLILSYISIYFKDKLWIKYLRLKYPEYEISTTKKIRTLIDTQRNAGIFHYLLQVKGSCDFNKIKDIYLNNLLEKRNKLGELSCPKLRKKLISRWGHYVWMKNDRDFDINNHVILSPTNYRGRPITENNIQEFISELATKYIPDDISPWQVIVIPIISASSALSTESDQIENESYYILAKIHHLLIAEEKNLHVSDLLMLNSENQISVYEESLIESPKLSDFAEKPKHILNLWNHIVMTVINRWNEFIYKYDPLESPDVDKKQQINCLSQFYSIVFITIVTVIGDFMKGYEKTNNQLKFKLRYLVNLYRREAHKRNINLVTFIDSLLVSINPVNIFINIVKFLWWFTIMSLLLSPYYMIRELIAIKEILFVGHTTLLSTYVGLLSIYCPLIIKAFFESIHIAIEIIRTPRNIYEELFEYRTREGNILQVKSYSGRKVISFSKSIDINDIRKRVDLDEIGETEFILACLADSLYKYLEKSPEHKIPSILNATCRSIAKEYFFEKYNKTEFIGGVVFIQLPLSNRPNKTQIKRIQQIIKRVREKQIAIYLLSIAQTKFELITSIMPDVWMKVFINYFSIGFPITITDIHGSSSEMITSWGQKVNDLLFFRPPQSKTCLSLNIHRFGNKCRLAVMADTQLAPDHSLISNFWEANMESVIL